MMHKNAKLLQVQVLRHIMHRVYAFILTYGIFNGIFLEKKIFFSDIRSDISDIRYFFLIYIYIYICVCVCVCVCVYKYNSIEVS